MVTPSRHQQGSGPPQVGPEVLALLAGCTADLRTRQQDLVLAVHQRLLELIPPLARTPGSGRPTCQRLVAAVLGVAGTGALRLPDDAVVVVQRVGAENHADGFPVDQYGAVTHALLHAVRVVYQGEWSSPLSSAWVEYLLWLRAQLLAGAEAQRAREAAAAPARAGSTAAPAPPGRAGHAARPAPSGVVDDLDDDDLDEEDSPGYSSLMSSMTLGSRRDRRR